MDWAPFHNLFIKSVQFCQLYLQTHYNTIHYNMTPGAPSTNMDKQKLQHELEWAASNGNRYPPYPQVMATAISQ